MANGARDPEKGKHDSYSPVAKLANARLVLAVLKQLDMDIAIADVSKACWKGRFNRGTVFVWAAPGHSTFPGECWEVLTPINGSEAVWAHDSGGS
jgi:hypothetical protein